MAQRNGIITLTTDFGTRDAYGGAMKGAVGRILPTVRLVDITHEIPPQQIVEAGGHCCLGPDIGVLRAPLRELGARAHEIGRELPGLTERSDTFHGRDRFAPAAVHLAANLELERLVPGDRVEVRRAPQGRAGQGGT